MSAPNQIETELTALCDEVRRLIESAEAGHPVDVTSLDGILPGLCERACSVPPAQRETVLAGLAQLEADLGFLARAIERQQQKGAATAPGQAAAAYGRSQGRSGDA